MQPPLANRIPHRRQMHGAEVIDDYAWLRERDNPTVMAYLEAENAYTEAATAHLSELRERLFTEIKGRVQEADRSAPARRGKWWYATSTDEGLQYPRFVRMHGDPESPEEVVLDLNELAGGHAYLRLGVLAVSPDQSLAAYSLDTDGSELFTMKVRDLSAGTDLPDVIAGTYYTAAWSSCGRYLFYVTVDHAHRPYRVVRHELGTETSDDQIVLEEPDERFFVSLSITQDRRYLLATSESHTTSEVRCLDAGTPLEAFRPIVERRHGVEYRVDHHRGHWLIVTNEDAPDGKLISTPANSPTAGKELMAHLRRRKLDGVVALADHIVVEGRSRGATAIFVLAAGDPSELREIELPEEVYAVALGPNLEHETSNLRLIYQSMVTPPQDIDLDLETGGRTIVKQMPVLGGYEPNRYRTWRQWATASDGVQIPISLVRRVDQEAGASPLLLYGYGAYEHPMDPTFSVGRVSLLDRGVTFAIAHVRGGGELGKTWYEGGKLAHKANTFTDFIACARALIDGGLTSPELLCARGRSAGGLLMGAAANLAPELFAGIVAEVPFVDVINTMLDESLPLTVSEWEEWGDPRDPVQYRWMQLYAPYENVRDVEFPAMLLTAGVNDPRVSYWEPAKLVARLRAEAKTRGPLLLKTDMGLGHSGPSGRYDAWREEAFVLAWLLDRWGLTENVDDPVG